MEGVVIGCFTLFASSSFNLLAQTVTLKPEEALKIVFHDSKEVVSETKQLTPSQKSLAEKRLGSPVTHDRWDFFIASTGHQTDGYALIDSEIGKTEPITFLVALTPRGEVKEVEILAYREPIGGEVQDARFLRQYKGKKEDDPIRLGQDISPVTGATLSSRAVSIGVKRVLVLWKIFYGK